MSPRGSIRRGEDGFIPTHHHEESVCVGDSPKYRDKTISEILKMKGVKPQNPQNVNKKLGRINTFWKWVGEKYPDYVKEQVFKGKDLPTAKSRKRKEERLPFTNEELQEIFNPHNYLFHTVQMKIGGKKTEYHYHSVRTHHLPYYWIPLIGVFSGMRLDLSLIHI